MIKYEDFVLTVNGAPGTYTVEARGPGDIAESPVRFAYEETEDLRVELNRIKMGFPVSLEKMQAVGELFFNALFPRRIIRAFEKVELPEGANLRLKLIVRPPELAHLPWELMYDPDQDVFLAALLAYPIVRFVETGTPAAKLLARRPLRVLYVQANPPGTNPLETMAANEKALRKILLEKLGAEVEIVSLTDATQAALQDRLREPFHILYYDGHASFDASRGVGYLYLHDAPLGGEMLGRYYLNNTAVRLVILSACETAVDSSQKRFSGIAHQLMLASSLPAVVAMQYSIPEQSAAAFTTEFFRALADEYPVDAAVIEGRKAILRCLGDDPFAAPDWATPVLFMRGKDGNILREEIKEDGMDEEKEPKQGDTHIETGGGAYIAGIVHGDEVHGDKVSGDKISVGNISGSTGIAIGRDARATVTQGLGGDDIAKVFAVLAQKVAALPDGPNKVMAQSAVQGLEAEAQKGEQAKESDISQWFNFLAQTAPDVLEVAIDTFINPISGLGTVFQKIARRAKEERMARK